MWAKEVNSKVISYIVRHYDPILDNRLVDSLTYDLTNRKGPVVTVVRQRHDTFFELQKLALLKLHYMLDIDKTELMTHFSYKGNFVFSTPFEKKLLQDCANMYPLVIPHMPKDWFPIADMADKVNPHVARLTFEFDKVYFARFGVHVKYVSQICPNDHLVTGVSLNDVEIPSLKILCLRKLSCYNIAYGGSKLHPYTSNAAFWPAAILPSKLGRLPKGHASFRPNYDFNDAYRGIKYYYWACVNEKRKIAWNFDPRDFRDIPLGSSKVAFHEYPVYADVKLDKFSTVRFVKNPTKNQAALILKRELYRALMTAAEETEDGEVPVEKNLIQPITNMHVKYQNLNVVDEGKITDELAADYRVKGRLFFLVNDSVLHRIFQFRKVERTYYPDCFTVDGHPARNMSAHNEIGTTWAEGGAYMKYMALLGDTLDQYDEIILPGHTPDNVCKTYRFRSRGSSSLIEGDISGLDSSITAMQLVIYMMFASIWIIKDEADHYYRIFQYLLEACSEQLAGKVVRWLVDYMLLLGCMPSGSLETSHGNTWIVINFYWFGYIFNEMAINTREIRTKIWRHLTGRTLAILVFGDDFIAVIPDELIDIITIERFAEYLERYFGVKMKNLITHRSLITYLHVENGSVLRYVYNGPSYLKRKFILASNFCLESICDMVAPVVSWRPFAQYSWRVAVPKDRTAPPYMNLSRLIGLAYDTLGVDPMAYFMIKFLFKKTYANSVKAYGKNFIDENFPVWFENDQKYMRKIGFQAPNSDFPTRDYLVSLNILNREYHRPKFPNIRTWQEAMMDTEIW